MELSANPSVARKGAPRNRSFREITRSKAVGSLLATGIPVCS